MEKMENRNYKRVLNCYVGDSAVALCAQYEATAFSIVHQHWIRYLPAVPAKIVDLGAGSGRDAEALAVLGFEVFAVEPSPSMLKIARELHPDPRINWIQDSLPGLRSLFEEHLIFDFFLLSAVWMHLESSERQEAMTNLWNLGKSGSTVVITLRHPAEPRRHMFDVTADEIGCLAQEVGFKILMSISHRDLMGRADVNWSLLIFQHS
jgi:SAM-dependent methyltransferase